MKSIILVGYMCAGKTTVGRALAREMGLSFYDLDWYIEERFRKRVSEIFAERGEEGFRDLERRMLHEAAEFEDTVLACGGGTPCFYDNMAYMNRTGTTIYLKASVETILAHLKLSRTVRPLLKDKTGDQLSAYITEQLKERSPYYEQAQVTVDVNVLDNFDKVKLITDNIQKELTTTDGKMAN